MRTDTAPMREDGRVPETKIRTVRVDVQLWEAAQAKAKRRRETVSAVLKRALVEYVGDDLGPVDMSTPDSTRTHSERT